MQFSQLHDIRLPKSTYQVLYYLYWFILQEMLVMCTFQETGSHEKAEVLHLLGIMKNVMLKMHLMQWMVQSWMAENWGCRWQDMDAQQNHTEGAHQEGTVVEAADIVEGKPDQKSIIFSTSSYVTKDLLQAFYFSSWTLVTNVDFWKAWHYWVYCCHNVSLCML